VLVVGLIGRRTTAKKSLDRRPVFGVFGRIVVVDLVVIPGDRERCQAWAACKLRSLL
jgi:hypothetical protein